jgi:eukaryotic-like serine/threonine-protein kinase
VYNPANLEHMANIAPTGSSGRSLARQRLDGWKAIADYLRRTVRTVQRWEREGLPVRRHLHASLSSVYADTVELDAWLTARTPDPIFGDASLPVGGDERTLTAMSRRQWALRTREGFYRGIGLAKAALNRNPNYAPAHAALARAHATRISYGHYLPAYDAELARHHAEAALALDSTLIEAYQALGVVQLLYDWRWHEAALTFRAALHLDSDDATTHQWFTMWYLALDRDQEAYDLVLHAMSLDPTSQIIDAHATWITYMLGRFDEALARAEGAVRRDRHHWRGYFSLAITLGALGRTKEAVEAADVAWALNDSTGLAQLLAHQLGRHGEHSRAHRVLQEATSTGGYMSGYWEAYAQAGLGDHDAALSALERSTADREWFLLFLTHEPAFRGLRTSSRFDSIRRAIGLPERMQTLIR